MIRGKGCFWCETLNGFTHQSKNIDLCTMLMIIFQGKVQV